MIGSETTKYDGSYTSSYGVNLTAGFDDWEHAYVANTDMSHTDRKVMVVLTTHLVVSLSSLVWVGLGKIVI